MAIATIQLPDGRIADIEVPQGATEADILAFVQSQDFSQTPSKPTDFLSGVAQIGATAVAGMGRAAIEGLSEMGGLVAGRGTEASVGAAQALTAELPQVPLGESGQALIQDISARFQAAPELVKEIVNAVSTLGPSIGESTFRATGSPLAATAAATLPGALEAATGLTGGRQLARGVDDVVTDVGQQTTDVFAVQSPTKQRIAKLIKEGSTDAETAQFKLAKAIGDGRPRVQADNVAKDAIKQGFDEGVIAAVKGASSEDKTLMKRMVKTMQKGKKNARFAATNRPSDVAGDSLMNRLRVIQGANKAAGKQLDRVAKDLKGQAIDFNPIGQKFVDDLGDIGVSVTDDLKLDFTGSDIEGLAGPERAINQIFNRMKKSESNDAFAAHRLKRFIDEQVTFGKNAEGLAGRAEGILKSLRRDIDKSLDANFPEYDRVNTAYSETIGALDAFQDVAGRKMNLTGENADKATGTLLRRVLSNAQSRITLLDSVDQIEKTAEKFKNFKSIDTSGRFIEGPPTKKFKDDLLNQVLFVDELDSVFGPVARTSFQGQIKQAVDAARSPTAAAIDVGVGVLERSRGINEEGAFRAINRLLSE